MRRIPTVGLGALVVVSFAACAAQATEWGDLTGRFVIQGPVPQAGVIAAPGRNVVDESVVVDPQGNVRNVLVFLRTRGVEVSPDYAATANDDVVLDAAKNRFDPRVLLMRTSQTLTFTNSENFGVDFSLVPNKNPAVRPVLQPGAWKSHQLYVEESLPVPVDSAIRPWLRAWVFVRESPYAAVSAADGTFTIRSLPAGQELQFQLWQERVFYLKNVTVDGDVADRQGRFKILIKPGRNDLGDIKIPAFMLR